MDTVILGGDNCHIKKRNQGDRVELMDTKGLSGGLRDGKALQAEGTASAAALQ